jgi:hypothetical protein
MILLYTFRGEDNCLLLWNLVPGGPTQPEITTLPFPDVEANSLEALMLPNLTQSVRYYICPFVAMFPLCIPSYRVHNSFCLIL